MPRADQANARNAPGLTSRLHPGGGSLNHINEDGANYTYCMLQ